MPLGQSEQAYYLSYFIKGHGALLDSEQVKLWSTSGGGGEGGSLHMFYRIIICRVRQACLLETRELAIPYLEHCVGPQITVGHRTLAERNLLMSDQSLTVLGHMCRHYFY